MRNACTALTERLGNLHDQWVAFAMNDEARLLIWWAGADELPLVEALIARECDDALAELPDLFVQLSSPFDHRERHGVVLMGELRALYDEATRTDDAHSFVPRAPAERARGDVATFIETLESLRRELLCDGALLAVWLTPAEVREHGAYVVWLRELVQRAPHELRFVIVADLAREDLSSLVRAEPARVIVERCELNMRRVAAELAAEHTGQAPGDKLRELNVHLGEASEAGDLARANALADMALRIASDQGWLQLAAGIELTRAATLCAGAQFTDAIAAYERAENFALLHERSELADDAGASARRPGLGSARTDASTASGEDDAAAAQPAIRVGPKLQLQARLGRSAALMASGSYAAAAQSYGAAAPLARAVDDTRSELDAYRLASVCYARAAKIDLAWETGLKALEVGQHMDEATRKTSTLPDLVEHLHKLTDESRPRRDQRGALQQQLEKALGKNWRAALQRATAAPA